MDKTRDVGILKALGARAGQITRIFVGVGLLIGSLGTALGFLVGVGICTVLDRYTIIQIPSDIYYFEKLPVDLRLEDAVLIATCAFFLSLVSTLYPAMQAAKLSPVEALHYE